MFNAKYSENVESTATIATTATTTTTTAITKTTTKISNAKIATATSQPITEAASAASNLQHQQQQQQQQKQQQQQTYLPQTSLLKIEPFVPSFNQRLRRRPFGRSYSTLSSSVIRKRNTANFNVNNNGKLLLLQQQPQSQQQKYQRQQQQQHPNTQAELIVGIVSESNTISTQFKRGYAGAGTGQLRQRLPTRNRGLVIRQRSKSTSSSAASINCRPTTAAALNGVNSTAPVNVTGAIVTPQPNGICRITRPCKEREEMPDRINYDRRGLTAVPIFEQEPHLRLLSLQHNLINIFHIPKDMPLTQTQSLQTSPKETNKLEDQTQILHNRNGCSTKQKPTHANNNNNNSNHSNAIRLPFTGNSPKCNSPTIQSPLSARTLSVNNATRHKLLKRHSLLQKNFNFNNAQLPQASIATPSPSILKRYTLEKSKSFVTNYTRHLQTIKQKHDLKQRHAHLLQCKTPDRQKLKSFDSSTSGLTTTTDTTYTNSELGEEFIEDSLQEQLAIKNKQLSLSTCYGNIFQHLVFLDLYDNQIERIANLDGLPTLTVLLLGKNRITDISGLSSLHETLRVLDLHGNKITSLSNKINCLHELKSLNLAGNQIRQINQNDFNGLRALKELNLKRNKLKRINGFQHLISLERLWLCHNELHKVDDIASIAKATRLLEVTIENNPVSLAGDCVSYLVSYLPLLQTLSQMPITEQVRCAALAWRQQKELVETQSTQSTSHGFSNKRREEVISNARTNWELLRSQQIVQTALRAPVRSPKKLTSELTKISEANETGSLCDSVTAGDNTSSAFEELQALIKLPPIEQQQQQQQQFQQRLKEKEADELASTDGSSLGPNVDSCSSCYSTDNEDSQPRKLRMSVDKNANKLTESQQATNNGQQQETTTKQTGSSGTLTVNKSILMNSKQADSNTVARVSGTTTTIVLPLPVNGHHGERPASSNSRLRGNARAALNTPTTPIISNSLGSLNNKLQTVTIGGPAATTATTTTCKRYTPGSLIRSQTVAYNGGALCSRTSNKIVALNQNGHNNQQTTTTTTVTTLPGTNSTNTIASMPAAANIVSIVAPAGAVTTTTTAVIKANAPVAVTVTKSTAAEREREQGSDYLIEICGRYLNIYGQGALRFIDKQWNPVKANDVHTLNFSYINFNNIISILGRIKIRFPHAENFVFRETNILCLGQLNALAELQGITTLYIDAEGNAITTKEMWRSYAIYRLSHWGLKQLNSVEVTETEIEAANNMYAGLSDLVLWSMPDVMLQPLLARLRLDETCTASKMSPKEWLMRADNQSLRLVVGKEALQWKKSANTTMMTGGNGNGNERITNDALVTTNSIRERGRLHFAMMMENTCNAVEKLNKLETLWPSMLLDIVRNTLLDYAQLDVYLCNLMREIMK